MVLILAGCWLLIVVLTLAACRAAGRADEQAERAIHRRTHAIGVVTAATALAGSCVAPGAGARTCPSPSADAPPPELASAIGCRIADVRAAHDLQRLRSQRQLGLAARRYAADMAQRDFFSHVSPEGARLRDRVIAAGYVDESCSWHVGEVLAWGDGTDASAGWIVHAWMRSPPHRRILVGADYEEIGIGVAPGAPVQTADGVPALTAAAVLGRRACPAG
jgi:uncharacterized protein YkwD